MAIDFTIHRAIQQRLNFTVIACSVHRSLYGQYNQFNIDLHISVKSHGILLLIVILINLRLKY
jgi:hypothetical protein